MSTARREKDLRDTLLHKLFLEILGCYLKMIYFCIKNEYDMDKRFKPRSKEELLKAVHNFQKRQQVMYNRLSKKLQTEVFQKEIEMQTYDPD